MGVVRLINKALSYVDIQRIPGSDAKMIEHFEMGNLYGRGSGNRGPITPIATGNRAALAHPR